MKNNVHAGTSHFVNYREVGLSSEVNNREGTLKCVLYREVFSYCVLYSESPLSEVLLYKQLTSPPARLVKGLIAGALGMGGNGGGMMPGRPIPVRSGRPGGLTPARGGVGNPERERGENGAVNYSHHGCI